MLEADPTHVPEDKKQLQFSLMLMLQAGIDELQESGGKPG